jgi:hypothetical protein
MIRTYSDLSRLETFEERFEYLKLGGGVGRATFGFDRFLNQQFYMSREWHDVRYYVISRDNGCDLGVWGHEIHVNLLIHHMNPMTSDDIINREPWILDPEYLITTMHRTHNAIHYGNGNSLTPRTVTERTPDDTLLWQRR